MNDEFPVCPIGDKWRGKPWSEVSSGFLRWMIGSNEDGDPLCEYVAARPKLQARVKQELIDRDRPEGTVALPGFE